MKKKFKIVTLGCRTNQYESQAYHDQLTQMGYFPAERDEEAEICIVNTCTVTESADSTSRYEIRQLSRKNPGAKIAVTGCFAERQPNLVKEMEGVTHVIPNNDKSTLLSTLFPEIELPEFAIKHFEAHTRAFVKVQDGCNSFCTYCIIPYVRGRSRSRSVADIVKEVEGLIANGYKEVVITGINVGDFDGIDPDFDQKIQSKVRLADLIRTIDQIPGLERLRLSSIDPDEVDDDLADAILNGKHTCHSMHIVLQSGSNVILKRMNRKYTRQIFQETTSRLLQASPDFTFTTDVIVGFPGETEADFQETLSVIREVQFAKVHMFPYSDRPRTRSALMPNKVPPEIMKQRKHAVMHLSEQVAYKLRDKFIGRTMCVLTENNEDSLNENTKSDGKKRKMVSGHTENFLKVYFPSNDHLANELVKVRFIKNTAEGIIGEYIENLL